LIVLDASAALDYLVDGGTNGDWVRERLEDEAELAAPHLIDLEVLSGLRKRVLRSELSARRAGEAVRDFGDLGLTRYSATELMPRIWALRRTLTPYDAAYVVLGEALPAMLVTTDARLARSHGHAAEIAMPPA
jgi:predicted nucleic acid-binding protein